MSTDTAEAAAEDALFWIHSFTLIVPSLLLKMNITLFKKRLWETKRQIHSLNHSVNSKPIKLQMIKLICVLDRM